MKAISGYKFLPIFLVISLATANAADLQKPLGPVVFNSAQGGYEVYWFYPELHNQALGNLHITPTACGVPNTMDSQYIILMPLRLRPPSYVVSAGVFISGRDLFPGSSGDEFTPLKLLLRTGFSDSSQSVVWQGAVARDSFSTSPGEVVRTQVNTEIDVFSLWLGAQWYPAFPQAPSVGLNRSARTMIQYQWPVAAPYEPPQESMEEFIMGVNILNWCSGRTAAEIASKIQSDSIWFNLSFQPDGMAAGSATILLDSIGIDSLRGCFDIPGSGNLTISVSDGQNSQSAEAVYLNKLEPRISINPPILDQAFDRKRSNEYSFEIVSHYPELINLKLDYDSNLIQLGDKILSIQPGGSALIYFSLKNPLPDDSTISTSIIVRCEGVYPVIYHIRLIEDKPLDIADNRGLRPSDFEVGEPYPNPFNPVVSLAINVERRSGLEFTVFNLLGQEVFKEEFRNVKSSIISWPGVDNKGDKMPAGLYLFRFRLNDRCIIKKGILLK